MKNVSDVDKYSKMTQREHILARPDTYIGDIEPTNELMYIYNNDKIIQEKITYTPGFYKIFDEIIINARDASVNDKSCNKIDIEYNSEQGYIKVHNNGDIGIPVEIKPEYNIMVPTMIFGELLTSSNYDDTDNRTTGGRNGLGSKCIDENTILYNYINGNRIVAKNIKIGDKIIGDDGTCRTVLNIIKGMGPMYEITQNNASKYIVNEDHILTLCIPLHKKITITSKGLEIFWWSRELKCILSSIFNLDDFYENIKKIIEFKKKINNDNIIDININDYLNLSRADKKMLEGIKGKCVIWDEIITNINPYKKGLNIGNNIYNYLNIPNEYIINSKIRRVLLLSGILNAVKYSNNNYFIIINESMKNIISFLIESLGLTCNIVITEFMEYKIYYSNLKFLMKCKNLNFDINTLDLDKLNTTGNLSIKEYKNGNYIGIDIDKNNRFVINDFTVTHNCANIFSTKFIVNIDDFKRKKRFEQIWENNMLIVNKEEISKLPDKTKNSITITYYPDIKRFGMDCLNKNICDLFYKRAFDIAAITNKVNITFNGNVIKIKDFKEYIKLYDNESTIFYDSIENWNVGVIYNISDKHLPGEVISFVNGINTYKGGTHCNYVIDSIIKYLSEILKKKDKNFKLNSQSIKNNFVFFINCEIINPSFSSQTKDTLTTKSDKFGSIYKPTEQFLTKLSKCGIINQMLELSKFKESKSLIKTDGKKQIKIFGIPKLEDANKAGSKDSGKCTLILTEGDSAKATAMAGISIIGRDYYGVFPLKGKLLNTRDAPALQLAGNEEIKHLKTIIGLKQNEDYSNIEKFKSLRYGHILLLTDSDVDGSHIKGLVINMFHSLWPSLIKYGDFIQSLTTPIIKCTNNKKIIPFYTLTEYNNWKLNNNCNGFKIKYYKGLGTSTSAEAKEYFTDINDKIINYSYTDKTDDSIVLAFDKSNSDNRKSWLLLYDNNKILEYDKKNITYSEFIDLELIHFSNQDNIRSLPSAIDGLKPSHRKILYGSFLRGLDKDEIKVSQLAGFVSDKAAYHHGEASLNSAIVGMAQNFTGSNNINILKPVGQFGTKMKGGKDCASPRYICTMFDDLTTSIFIPSDNPILINQTDDGIPIEPLYYIPIIPMILVNGTEGIGTGFSTKVPSYNPIDIFKNIKNIINGKKLNKMIPWWKNFKGTVVEIEESVYEIKGVWKITGNKLIITELPVFEWTSNYKEFLEKLIETKKKQIPLLSYSDNNTDTEISFELVFDNNYLSNDIDISKIFHLSKKLSISNMHLYDINNKLKKYINTDEIITDFYNIRLELYEKRKEYQLRILKYQLDILNNKTNFILNIIEKKIDINNKPKKDIEEILDNNNFTKLGKSHDDDIKNYEYLLTMPIYNVSKEKLDDLLSKRDHKITELSLLEKKTINEIWVEELDILEKKYKTWNNT